MIEILILAVASYALLWAFYAVALPLFASLRPSDERSFTEMPACAPSVAVIIPAHNMTRYIERCVSSLLAADYPQDRLDIYVVADHCDDDTAERAASCGATVLVRDVGPRGKTYALGWAFEQLGGLAVDPELYVIVDATAHVDTRFLISLAARYVEGEDIVIGRAIVDPENRQWFAQCLGLTLAHRNLQNLARQRLGLSALISGRGMAYSRGYIKRFGWSLALPSSEEFGAHPTEDWRHGVRAVAEGVRASFAANARVYTPLRESLGAATHQGIRWERGRVSNAFTHAWRLLMVGLRQHDLRKVVAAMDAIQPPVAVLGGASVLLAVMAVAADVSSFATAFAIAPLVVVSCYAIAVVAQGRLEGIKPAAILWAPVYVVWRCFAFVAAVGYPGRVARNLEPRQREDI